VSNEIAFPLISFIGVFSAMTVWELLASRRSLRTSKRSRWFCNLAITILNAVLVRWVSPIVPFGMALFAEERTWGLLNNLTLPYWVAVVVGVLALDLGIYLQHVLFHAIPLLWRLHLVHHADLDVDVTTGLRFHPIEMAVSLGIKLALVVLLGPPALAVLVFEILLNGTSMFNHSNIRLHRVADRYLRWLVVTPDMHRVHHSIIPRETNSNFGFNLPWWDRLFGTYRDQPSEGHKTMTVGLSQLQNPERLTLPRVLALPFLAQPGPYSINLQRDRSKTPNRS